jgi:hypothetical protein
MLKTALPTNRRTPTPSPAPAGNEEDNHVVRRLRFNRTIGFWLGGIVLGTAGCIIGAAVPYEHPVAVTTSMVWWGIYIGSFGGSVGALIGVLIEGTGTAPPRVLDRTAEPPSEVDEWFDPAAGNAFVNGAPLTAEAVSPSQPAGRTLAGVEAR